MDKCGPLLLLLLAAEFITNVTAHGAAVTLAVAHRITGKISSVSMNADERR